MQDKNIHLNNTTVKTRNISDNNILWNSNDCCFIFPDKIHQTFITSSSTGEHISHIHPTTSAFTGYTQGLPDNSGLFSNKVEPLSNGNFNFYTTGLETSPEHKQLYSSLDTTISTTGMAFTQATTALQTVHPLNSSLNTFSMIPSVALMPTNVNHTLQDSFTTFSFNVPHSGIILQTYFKRRTRLFRKF